MAQTENSIDSVEINHSFAQNLVYYFKHLIDPTADPESIKVDESLTYAIFNTKLNLPIFNGTLILHDVVYEEILEMTNTEFVVTGIPFQLWLSPELDKKKLIPQLKKDKFRYIGDSHGVAIDINNLNKDISYPKSLYVEIVNSQERFKKWLEITALQFNYRGTKSQEYAKRFENVNFNKKPDYWIKYIGWLNGEPVVAGTLIYGKGMSMIYDDAILTKFSRNRYGIDDAMVLKMLNDSLKRGVNISGTFTTVGELKKYLKLGFVEKNRFAKFIKILPSKRK